MILRRVTLILITGVSAALLFPSVSSAYITAHGSTFKAITKYRPPPPVSIVTFTRHGNDYTVVTSVASIAIRIFTNGSCASGGTSRTTSTSTPFSVTFTDGANNKDNMRAQLATGGPCVVAS